ncbi:hypothetical protein MYU51_009779 [Penicillium brevicompactum]|uniref:uncharacterized protein n=1 Tax=Penicillium brevicompactum TaxID=5074 RepID=UPI00253FFB03|nr:uncharacterized protein N7506_001017 [Penicillium brevicompactum]KAJ5347764.1 hypothetical protein N7506_001017 [Penicillium brevicompactum]
MWIISGPASLCKRPVALRAFGLRSYSTKTFDPLRILFCGSDEFSIASLNALHAYHLKHPERVSSIDVVCRPGKRVGRGLKEIREVPIKAAASALSLPIHEIDTFTGWKPPTSPSGPINLIIAVSFGRFVPPRILNGAKYGGLNVHPSLLPDFRGPAPLHHTLLAGETKTGVTVQTLHHENFDHGVILSQTPAPGFDVPNPDSCTFQELQNLVAPKGAHMLVESIENGSYVPPLKNAGWRSTDDTRKLIHASKITPEDRHIKWAEWTSAEISRRSRVIGPLWSKAFCGSKAANASTALQQKRVILTDTEEIDPPFECQSLRKFPGLPFTNASPSDEPGTGELYVFTVDGKVHRINRMKVEGYKDSAALPAARKARMLGDRAPQYENGELVPFHNMFV